MVSRDASPLDEAAADVDTVIDYAWGAPAGAPPPALLTRRAERGPPLDWIEIGSVAGPDIAPSLGGACGRPNLRILGTGQGSVTTAAIVAELPPSAASSPPDVAVNAKPVPATHVEATGARPAPRVRVVFTP